MEAAGQEPLMFDDVAIYFTLEEWGSLEEWQKMLYKEVMLDNYHALQSLGIPVVKSELLLLIEGGEEPCLQGHPRWEELGCERQTATDRQGDTEDVAAYSVWTDRWPLTYRRRVVRKRCGRRSPNFSRVELECFVSLMDRYLPDELQRAGTISLRQRRSILQEIARCLEPMSGCLRTPRQLLHRWADFNNRDPERLMEIRMQLLAAGHDQSWDSSDVHIAPSIGRRRGLGISHPLSSSSSSEEEEEEEEEEAPVDLAVWEEGIPESSTHYFLSEPSLPSHIDAQGRYIVPPPEPRERWWQRCAGDWMDEQRDVQGSPGRRTSAPSYSSLHEPDDPIDLDPEMHAACTEPELRMIKSEPDSEEDEGGGSWSSDISSPESNRRKMSESSEQPSPEGSYPSRAPPAGDLPGARSIKRSPNFSQAELESFVALMDHFLPDNLIRAGAIPIRQRKAILQEIARRLEPLSGCLRTPRQLRHRWTDFNNRDPDRLEEIRRRLRRASRKESCKKPSKAAVPAPAAGNKWRRRHCHPVQRDIKQEEPSPEQMRLDPSEEHTPTIPWQHFGLPKLRNSFSTARLKKNRRLALHILRMERLLQRVDQRQDLLLQKPDLSADEEDCAELETRQMQISI